MVIVVKALAQLIAFRRRTKEGFWYGRVEVVDIENSKRVFQFVRDAVEPVDVVGYMI